MVTLNQLWIQQNQAAQRKHTKIKAINSDIKKKNSQSKNIPCSGSSMNRRSSLLRRATVCKAKPLCFCRPFRGWGWLTMPAILSTLMPQMTVSVAPRQVTESRDQRYTQAATPAPAWAQNQTKSLIILSAVPSPHTQD